MKKEDLKNLYKTLYSITVEMSELIEKEDFDGLDVLLKKKDELIAKVNEEKPKISLSDEEKAEFNSIIIPVKELENKNIQIMVDKQNILKKKIAATNREYKTISSYNIKQEIPPSILDARE